MKIRKRRESLSKPKPMTCLADHTVREAVALMAQKDCDAIIVVDSKGRDGGPVTERDLMRRLINEGRDPDTTKVGEIMTSDVKVAQLPGRCCSTRSGLAWWRACSGTKAQTRYSHQMTAVARLSLRQTRRASTPTPVTMSPVAGAIWSGACSAA